jgi:hypothetical protein
MALRFLAARLLRCQCRAETELSAFVETEILPSSSLGRGGVCICDGKVDRFATGLLCDWLPSSLNPLILEFQLCLDWLSEGYLGHHFSEIGNANLLSTV